MTFSQLTLPPVTVNGYLWHTMKRIEPSFARKYGQTIPFFPLSDSASGTKSWEDKTYIIYDRMLRMNQTPFPYIKKEHLIYAVKGKEQSSLEWGMALQYILDRRDDAAQDINDWNRAQENPAGVYFHSVKVHQVESSRSRDFSTRPYYITEFIVELEYHLTDSIESFLS